MVDMDGTCSCGGFAYAGHRCRVGGPPKPTVQPYRELRDTAARALDRVRSDFPPDEAQVVVPLVRDELSRLDQTIRSLEGPTTT